MRVSSLDRIVHRASLRRWERAAAAAEVLDARELKALRNRARMLSQKVERVLHVAEGRLAVPFAEKPAVRRPMHSDWGWRPELWSGPVRPTGYAGVESRTLIGEEAKIFHDCTLTEIAVRQVRNLQPEHIAPFGLRIDVFRFAGSFLSLALDLPPEAVDGLSRRHLIRLEMRIETESPLEVFGRLNVRHGPNVEQLVREVDGSNGEFVIEFDLAASKLNEARVERAWLDLIFEDPEMNQITLHDVTLSRRPRADV